MKIVRVVWLDSTLLNEGGWMEGKDVDGSLTIAGMRHESVGYLVEESDHAIAVAGSRNDGDTPDLHNTRFADVIVIPRCAVLERYDLVDKPRGRSPSRT